MAKNKLITTDVVGEQYALQLFEETIGRKGRTATIADAEGDLAFPKNNIFVDVSGVGVLARRGLNVMNYLACDAPADVVEFECDVGLFKFLLNYQSRNHKHLNEALREAQKTSVVVRRERPNANGSHDFVSIPLVGIVGVAGGKVYFKFDPAIRKLHKDPRGFTFLSLRTTSAFTSVFAHSLYEKLKSIAFRGSPTDWLTLEEARKWTGAADAKFMAAWPEFRRRALLVAIEQINELSDLFVEVETKSSPGSKKVTHLRFVFSEQEGKMVQSLRQTETRKNLYETLRGEFGIGAVDLQAIAAKAEDYTPERIQAAIEFVRHRMATQRKKISAPGRYLMKAIQEGWSIPKAELEAGVTEPAAVPAPGPAQAAAVAVDKRQPAHERLAGESLQREYQEQGERGYALYLAAEQAQRAELRVSFARTLVFRALGAQMQRAKGPITEAELRDTPRLQHAFGQHVLKAVAKASRGVAARSDDQAALFTHQ
ncbi:replication initiation protein [Azohydromonas lata]|uniref:Replication initiation protein n=1 Tax=Azohydromonas lata TaxID=45677 RepID=A0ABU5IHH0_9BURK|nr:replication initiation protein [Azohydromonas lata]MDZ5458437.1 replication initiation protein [Azohydromonas lata]